MLYAQAQPMPSCDVRMSVCLSRSCILWKPVKIFPKIFHHRVSSELEVHDDTLYKSTFYYLTYLLIHTILFSRTERYSNIQSGSPITGVSNAGRVNHKNLAIANRSRVSCAHNMFRAFIGLNITP